MLIELIGPAGCGKTETARRAEAILREGGIEVLGFDRLEELESEIGTRSFRAYRRATRWRATVGLLMKCPDIILPILFLSWLYGPEESTGTRARRERHAGRALGHVRMALALRRTAADRVVLMHEGFTQVLWTLLIDSPSLRAKGLIRFTLARYHQRFRQLGVRLVVDDDTVMQRVFARDDKGRFNRDSSDQQRRDFPRWLEDHRALVAMLPDGLIEAEVDGSGSSERVAGDLAAAVRSFMPLGQGLLRSARQEAPSMIV
ncbi:MAG: hypothetical protein OEU92_24315 [Alphaproteobacteria bacterium]|nr:hypothetical protein [Alphaproteobacteria bacterium]